MYISKLIFSGANRLKQYIICLLSFTVILCRCCPLFPYISVAFPPGSVTIDIATVLADFAIAFIVVGVFIMVVAVLGMCGACCTSRCMLITVSRLTLQGFRIRNTCRGEPSQIDSPWPSFCQSSEGEGRNEGERRYI